MSIQYDEKGKLLPRNLYQIVVVDNNSKDRTANIVKDFTSNLKNPKTFLISEPEKGVVPSRISGYNFVLENETITTPYLASGDADVYFNKSWVNTIISDFKQKSVDVISCAGCFPDSFWQKVPILVERYLNEIGTIFFNKETINRLGLKGKKFLFTEQIFLDFIRPVTDGCFAITKDAYLKAGGYTREFWDKEKKEEVYGEGWRLVFNLERTGAKIFYENRVPYESSPRRLLEEPEKFLGATSYNKKMADLRSTVENHYTNLNEYAKNVDLKPVQKYIIDYYVLLKCITRPELIKKNPKYFSRYGEEIYKEIINWWNNKKTLNGKNLFLFSNQLGDKYFSRLMKTIPKQVVV